MKISLHWLNQHLAPPTDIDQAQRVLTAMGFPVEDIETVTLGEDGSQGEGEDAVLDVEVTSNRGDCLSHLGMARELAAGRGQQAMADRGWMAEDGKEQDSAHRSSDASDQPSTINHQSSAWASITIHRPDLCPLYTARVMTGVSVGPSPRWLVDRLKAIGLRSVNNVVDVTNFVLHDMGQPLHAFDLGKLAGGEIRVRSATQGEAFKAIDGSTHTLDKDMLVIADADRPVAIAGVMGGVDSEVGAGTTDVMLEAAVFDPLSVRTTSRALKLASDSSYRFERGLDPAGVEAAGDRAARLIVELAGGTLQPGVIQGGEMDPQPREVAMRVDRCNTLLGLALSADQQAGYLQRLGLGPRVEENRDPHARPQSGPDGAGGTIVCRVPSFRLDLRREVDLIEEVARCHGLDGIPLHEKIQVVVRPPQSTVGARREVARVLTAHGYHEAVTFSFVSEAEGEPFTPEGAQPIVLADERRKAEPMLRPSLVPSLLICRKANQDAGNADVRLYEMGATWASPEGEAMEETARLTLGRDAPDPVAAMRELRGTVVELIHTLAGDQAAVVIDPIDRPGYDVAAAVRLGAEEMGTLGVLNRATADRFGLRVQPAAAELDLAALLALYPPKREAIALPRFPAIERDLSIVVSQAVTWREVTQAIDAAAPPLLEEVDFLGVYRGKPIPKDAKSINFRMLFRDPEHTLRHEQVDPQVQSVVERLKDAVGAELRA